ncbi:PAAR domain-containing protein [Pseudomonas cremoricolorata]|uniref:PAAR repeat-containing protein n=1 Tax=Pseudomonas cremoricolorata TaxID=157783 RepID=A0A089WTZ5_9PSED|nr:PAAR domain-containing protein [Pseudomonas cremoricolorata]AIR90634.1 PAAR repeat-containing protein [Pseudomonas cremoricolorata]
MKPIVLVGHAHSCPLHGQGAVETGSSATLVDDRPVARAGDRISCGAVIETGAACTIIEGRPVAREGDRTSHGGTLVEGDSGWLVD